MKNNSTAVKFDAALWASESLKFIHKDGDDPPDTHEPIALNLVCLKCGHFSGFSRHVLGMIKAGGLEIKCAGCRKDITSAAVNAAQEYFHENEMKSLAALKLAESVDREMLDL